MGMCKMRTVPCVMVRKLRGALNNWELANETLSEASEVNPQLAEGERG